jgi:hypothetical protein
MTRKTGEMAMDVSLERQKLADVPAPQTPDELVKLICKLRWIGMDDEAERLSKKLTQLDTASADSVAATPHATD